ncbi:MAG: conjugal transfer protein TraG N-terminal domain-containing protein [Proteobacteria bacterium]|nr:conjugal transfer protein TraG N-terminal domain-containing protein [Pseudomonadota bacterium]
MAYEIYTCGNGEILKGVFDAIAMCLNGHSGTLYEPLKRIGLIMGAFWAAIYALFGDQVKVLTHWIMPMVAISNLLFVPTTEVWIHDPVTHYHQKVDHVPYGLAAFAGNISKIGHLITEQVEKVFSLPDDLRYQKSGTLFASNIMMQAKKFRIVNDDIAQNMRSFVGQCVVYDVMLGRKYTMQDLKNTDDIWGLISQRASPNRSFVWRDPTSRRSEIITCQIGVQKFNAVLGQEIDRTATVYGKRLFGKGSVVDAKVELLKYLPIAYSALGNISKSATDILKQQMMITSIIDGIESGSQAVGNAPNFAAKRAYLQQRSTYETLGAMAADTLPTMKAVLEAIAYAFFLFVIPLAFLPFGYSFLFRWMQILIWLQMWAPLYAVLNFIMTMAAKIKTVGALSVSNEAGITIASSLGVYNMNADISAMAGYLAMSIPFLSIALVKGVGSFVHMASHLGNVSQSAAGHAASEVTSGNFSYGNITEGTSQISNSSQFQNSRAASYRAGSFQYQDGRSDITTMGDGSQIANIGTSNLPISVNAAESMSTQQSEMAAKSYQKGLNLSESSGQSLASSARSMVSLSNSLSQMEQSGDSAIQNISTEESRSIHKGAQLIQDFAKQNNIDDVKSAELLGSLGLKTPNNIPFVDGSLRAQGSISSKDQELFQKAQKFAEDHNFQEAMRESSQASKNLSHNLSDENAKRLAEDVSGSYEKGMQQRSEASKNFSESENYQQQAMFTKANSANINRNANQEFFDWLSNQPADNAPGKMGKQAAAYTIAHEPELTMEYARHFSNEKGFTQNTSGFEGQQQSLRSGYDQENRQNVYAVTKDAMNEVRSKGTVEFEKERYISSHPTRQHVESVQQNTKSNMNESISQLQEKGNATKDIVIQNQQKGVVRRLGEKGVKEVKNTAKDVKDFFSGESQQG